MADRGPERTGPAEAIPPTTTRDEGGAHRGTPPATTVGGVLNQEGETVLRSDSEGSDASAVSAVGPRQRTAADGVEHERLLSLYHAVAAALGMPAPSGPLAIAAGAAKGKPNSKAEGPQTEVRVQSSGARVLRKTMRLGTGGEGQGPASYLYRQCLRAGRVTKQLIIVNMKMRVRREAKAVKG